MGDLAGLARDLLETEARVAKREHEIAMRAAKMLQAEIRSAIGTYRYGWAALAPSTVAKKGADTPLLDTGALRTSIKVKAEDHQAWTYSDDPKAAWHEFGTSHMPPRPMFGPALARKGAAIEAMAAKQLASCFHGHGLGDRLLHWLQDKGEELHEKLDDLNEEHDVN